MKKLLILLFSIFIFSCDTNEEYEDLNRDPNNPTQVSSASLFTAATKSLFDQMESPNVNINIFRFCAEYWTATTYLDEPNFDLVTRNISLNHWSELYRDVLFDLQDAKSLATTENQKAMISVLEVYTWQVLVDTFGDIPYTEALQGSAIPNPVYDNDAAIYTDLLARINAAITQFSAPNVDDFTGADLIYGGDLNHWKKFANSVKLKLAMRMADVNSATSATAAQQAVTAGVFTSNGDNATLGYQAATPNTNPLWLDLVQSGRSDYVAANTIVDAMNATSDPRRPLYFRENLGAGVFVGGVYGASSAFPTTTQVGDLMYDPTFRGVLLDYAEVRLLLAEAVERGYSVGGTAAVHYAAGIEANMLDWGVAPADIATYLARTDVAYATAAGTWKQKIGKQFWLAMYNRGFEGWSAYRKYDAPVLPNSADENVPVPKRFTYPLNEQTLNRVNFTAAATAIGGDTQQTKVFWDVN